jgi:hypothetical protein
MEAIREGVEDYEYLVMLLKSVNLLEEKGFHTDLLHEAHDLLDNGPKEVCGISRADASYWNWVTEKDRTGADRVRIKVLELLNKLQKAVRAKNSISSISPTERLVE